MLAKQQSGRLHLFPGKEHLLQSFQNLIRVTVLLATDGLAIFLALAVAYHFSSTLVSSANPQTWGFFTYALELLPIYVAVQLLLFSHYNLYSAGDGRRSYRKATLAVTVGCMMLYVGTSFYNVAWFSRGLMFLFWLASLVTVLAGRWLMDKAVSAFYHTSVAQRPFLVIGPQEESRKVGRLLQRTDGHPYQYVGFVPVTNGFDAHCSPSPDLPHEGGGNGYTGARVAMPTQVVIERDRDFLGKLPQLNDLVEQHKIREIFVAANLEKEQFLSVLDVCVPLGIKINIVSELLYVLPNPISLNSINGMPIVEVHQPALNFSEATLKRLFDLTTTVVGLLCTWWVFALIALAIKLDSPGPVLFSQRRVGYKGKEFTCYKFRSMVADAEEKLPAISHLNEREDPLMFKIKEDPRVTRVGRFLRRTSLDELPQVLNVIRGEMSLVGPRPPLPREVEMYKEHHRQRLTVLPGITGMWQVNGRSEVTNFEDVVRLDLAYIKNWSLVLDFKILARTLPVVIKSRGAF